MSKVSEIDRRISAASNGELLPGQVVILRVLREARKGIDRKALVRGCGLALPVSPKGGLYSSDWHKILKDLGHRRLVSIQASSDDGRRRLLHAITAAGKLLLEKAEKAEESSNPTPPASASDQVKLPEEVSSGLTYNEGSVQQILVNRYERDSHARNACISHYGTFCVCCGFDFVAVYGEVMVGFIHIHHLNPLSSVGPGYKVDPIHALRPVCPNCHAVLHRREPPYSLDEVRQFLQTRRGGAKKVAVPEG